MDAKKTAALAYLEAYTRAQDLDLKYEQAIKVQFGGKASRWDFPEPKKRYNSETMRAFLDKVNADHEMRRTLQAMRAAGASLADLEPEEAF